MKKQCSFILSLVATMFYCWSQQSVDATGGSVKSVSYTFAYSVGEIGSVTLGNKAVGFATGGVIQPDPLVSTATKDYVSGKTYVYPIPAQNELLFYPVMPDGLRYEIYSTDGILVFGGRLNNNRVRVHFLASGVYFMFVYSDSGNQKVRYNFIKG